MNDWRVVKPERWWTPVKRRWLFCSRRSSEVTMLLQRKTLVRWWSTHHWSLAGGILGNMGTPTFSLFLPDGAITIRNLLTRGCFMPLDSLNGKSTSLVLWQFLRIIGIRLILCAQLVAASNVKSHRMLSYFSHIYSLPTYAKWKRPIYFKARFSCKYVAKRNSR